MGVYIPNMSKPKDSCWNCKAQYNSVCSLKREHIRFDGILDDCPLIEIDEEAIDIAQDIMDGCKELKERVDKGIVRCGECRWSRPRTFKGETGYRCVFYRVDKAETGYCDCGERKESE